MGAIGLDADLLKIPEEEGREINKFRPRYSCTVHERASCSWARAREINSARAMLWVLAS